MISGGLEELESYYFYSRHNSQNDLLTISHITLVLLSSFFSSRPKAKSQLAEGFHNHANAKLIKEDFSGAKVNYNKAIRLRSSFSMAYFNRRIAKYHLEDKMESSTDWIAAQNIGLTCVEDNIKKYCPKKMR